ncbi:hypothetical protein Mycsm_01259 [Mycobacterium sp. JS623]|nr:hypothetical protein Mycsm_01259 [Mycobacterium sp. JS623]
MGLGTYLEWRQRWPELLVSRQTDEAVDLLRRYYATFDGGKPRYTGSRFEAFAALNNEPDVLGPADFVAVSMLSVNVPPQAAIRLVGPDANQVTMLLKQIPADCDIVDADPESLGADSAAGQLWDLLRGAKDGVGRTTTSKLMAVKRPRLFPIWDSFVEQATGLGTSDYWRHFQTVLVAEDRAVWNWLNQLRSEVSDVPAEVSPLRILDVLLWMSVEGG